MSIRVLARTAGLLGGLCWVARAVTDERDMSDAVVDALHWGGLALIALSLVGLGAGLVSSSAAWLQVVVAICLPLLAWSVVEALRGELPDQWVEGGFGLVLALYCAVGLLRGRRHRHRHRGSHAK